MDDALLALFQGAAGKEVTGQLRFPEESEAYFEIVGEEGAPRRYVLKPLAELYGPGDPSKTADPQDDYYMPLFLKIEETIRSCAGHDPRLTDAQVSLTLSNLSVNPESHATGDSQASGYYLTQALQAHLQLLLSVNDYSRSEVRQALRKVNKSVQRHTQRDGPRGYLRFIREALRA